MYIRFPVTSLGATTEFLLTTFFAHNLFFVDLISQILSMDMMM